MEINPNSDDISSYANFNDILQKEVDIDVSLDFDKKQMIGKMDVKYEILSSDIPKIILDLKGPEITSIEYIEKDEDEEDLNNIPLTYEILTENKYKDSLGTPLIISLDNIEKNSPEACKKYQNQKV